MAQNTATDELPTDADCPVPETVLTRSDEEPVQTWGTEHEWYEVYPNEDIGTVAVEYYNNVDGWSHVETRIEHITRLARD